MERQAHAGCRGGLSHGNGASFPGVFGGVLSGLGVSALDSMSRRLGHRGVVLAVSAPGMDDGLSSLNRMFEAHTSTSYSKSF